jgi:hypothetical protein
MIKYICFLWSAFVICVDVSAQDSLLYGIFPVREGKVTYESVIEVPNTPAEELYTRAKLWALSAFKSQKAALQSEDKTLGLQYYQGYLSQVHENPQYFGARTSVVWDYWNDVRVYVKENRAKIIVQNNRLNIRGTTLTTVLSSDYNLVTFKEDADNFYKKANFNNAYRTRYWEGAHADFKVIDKEYRALLASFEKTMTSSKKESDF